MKHKNDNFIANVLEIGQVYNYTDTKNNTYPVYILSGDYEINGRISNHWQWKRINKNGSLGRSISGYNNMRRFTEFSGKFRLTVTLISKG